MLTITNHPDFGAVVAFSQAIDLAREYRVDGHLIADLKLQLEGLAVPIATACHCWPSDVLSEVWLAEQRMRRVGTWPLASHPAVCASSAA